MVPIAVLIGLANRAGVDGTARALLAEAAGLFGRLATVIAGLGPHPVLADALKLIDDAHQNVIDVVEDPTNPIGTPAAQPPVPEFVYPVDTRGLQDANPVPVSGGPGVTPLPDPPVGPVLHAPWLEPGGEPVPNTPQAGPRVRRKS
jgi:hypothetical protein